MIYCSHGKEVVTLSKLNNIPNKNQCGVYTIINRRTGRKYIGSSTQLKKRAEVHKREIARGKRNNKLIQQDILKNDDFDFKIMQIIDESSYLYYDEIRNKMYLEEYQLIKSGILNGEDLYNLETINVINGRLKHIKEDQEKVLKRKNEVYEMLKLPNDKLIYTYKHNIYAKHELKLFEEEILKRMS